MEILVKFETNEFITNPAAFMTILEHAIVQQNSASLDYLTRNIIGFKRMVEQDDHITENAPNPGPTSCQIRTTKETEDVIYGAVIETVINFEGKTDLDYLRYKTKSAISDFKIEVFNATINDLVKNEKILMPTPYTFSSVE